MLLQIFQRSDCMNFLVILLRFFQKTVKTVKVYKEVVDNRKKKHCRKHEFCAASITIPMWSF